MGVVAELEVDERRELTILAEGHSACWPTSTRAGRESSKSVAGLRQEHGGQLV